GTPALNGRSRPAASPTRRPGNRASRPGRSEHPGTALDHPPRARTGDPLATLVGRVRILAGMREPDRAARASTAECLSGSPATDDAALMVSELFTNAILYTRSGQPGGVVTVTIATGRGRARIHVIDQGAHLERIDAGQVAAIIAAAPRLGAGLTIV